MRPDRVGRRAAGRARLGLAPPGAGFRRRRSASPMHLTPLQTVLGFALLGPDARIIFDAIVIALFTLAAIVIRQRRALFPVTGLLMCAAGFAFDLLATPGVAVAMGWAPWAGGVALVMASWGVIHLLLALADHFAHRTRAHFSTIFKDLLMVTLWGVILMLVLRQDFHFDLTPLLASTAIVAAVIGFALQESLGNIFSGLTLQLSKPFDPGDWVRSGNFVGRIQGIGWRSTSLLTRSNEKLEIPNSMLAKDALVNYSADVVGSDLMIGVSYAAPPNHVRAVICEALGNVPGVRQTPPPEVFTWEYADSAIRYRIRYWIADYAEVDRIHDAVATALWYVLRRKGVEIPYPQMVVARAPKPAAGLDENLERELMNELRQVDFLRDLSDAALRLLLPGVVVQKYGAGEAIVREGQEGDSLFLIRAGTVEVLAAAADGRTVHIRDLTRPAFFGEMALMTGERRIATVRAHTDAELIELGRAAFGELFKNHPETAAQMGEVIARRMSERRELLAAAPQGDGAHTRANWLLTKMRAVFNLSLPR